MSRYKAKNGTPEVHTARNKLDGVLQTLREKKDDQPPQKVFIKEEENDSDPGTYSYSAVPSSSVGRPSSSRSPTRHSSHGGRRKKKDVGYRLPPVQSRTAQFQHTYVMKLFERSVDLAQFRENTSLYPVCRAWLKNDPHKVKYSPPRSPPRPSSPMDEDMNDDDSDFHQPDVYKLPAPLEDIEIPRWPEPLPQPPGHLNIHQDPAKAPAPRDLLVNHLNHWKKVRQSWRTHSRLYDSKWGPSFYELQTIYENATTRE